MQASAFASRRHTDRDRAAPAPVPGFAAGARRLGADDPPQARRRRPTRCATPCRTTRDAHGPEGPGERAHLGRQPPRVLRRWRDVLAREQPPRRGARLARAQPQPAGIRRQRPAAVGAGHHPRDRRCGRASARRGRGADGPSCSGTPWAVRWRCSSPMPTPSGCSASSTATARPHRAGSTGAACSCRCCRPYFPTWPASPTSSWRRSSTRRTCSSGRRLASTLRGLWPDAHRNLRSMGRTLPVGSMLMAHGPAPRGRAHRGGRHAPPPGLGLLRPDRESRHGPGVRRAHGHRHRVGSRWATPGCCRAPRARATSCGISGAAGTSSPTCSPVARILLAADGSEPEPAVHHMAGGATAAPIHLLR